MINENLLDIVYDRIGIGKISKSEYTLLLLLEWTS